MKIGFCLDIDKKDASSGKAKFFIRLAKEMRKRGVHIDNNNPDIYIYLPGTKTSSNAIVNVLRLDGLIMNTRWDHKAKNKKIFKSIKQSDAIIYQGNFCREAYEKFLGVSNKVCEVIPNGAHPEEFLPRNPKKYFLANCKWKPHKRLKDTIKSYSRALDMGLDADLMITGEPDYKKSHPRIKYLKWQSRDQVRKMLSEAIASIHLTWLDWCPNSMVEAVVAGCPIIYTKSGGHTELGEGSGIGIKDTRWKFNLIDLYSPPKIDRNEVAKALLYMESNKEEQYLIRNDLNIETTCDRYLSYFDKLLNDRKN